MAITGVPFYVPDAQVSLAMSAETLKPPSRLCGLLSAYNRYQTGIPGLGVRINHLLGAPESKYITGNTPVRTQTKDATVKGHYVPWSDIETPLSINGTDLEDTSGIRSGTVLGGNFDPRQIPAARVNGYASYMQTQLRSSVSGLMLDQERVLWGKQFATDNIDLMPEAIPQVFDEDGKLHGLGPEDLGKFDKRHALGEGSPQFPDWEYIHKPRVYHMNHTDGYGGEPASGTADKQLTRENIFESLEEPLRTWDMIVDGMKLMPVSSRIMSLISNSKQYGQSDKFPMVIYDGMGWQQTIQVVRIHNTVIYADSGAPLDEMYGLHIGNPGMEDGSFFPVWWMDDDDVTIQEQIESVLMEQQVPPPVFSMGGPTRMMPIYNDEWGRFDDLANAFGTKLRGKHCYVCTARWKQQKLVGFSL